MPSPTLRANIGAADRAIRVGVGLILLALVFTGPRTLWGLVGLVPLATAAFSFCPLYTILGISTCSTARASR